MTRTGFAGWRDRRPFWGGLLVTLAGAEILFTEKAPMHTVIRIGLLGLAGYIVPALMVLCGLLLIFHPVQRVFYSLVAVLATLGSWITSNIGGFFIGLLLGLVGSTLAFGWLPEQPLSKRKARRLAERPATPA
ncbi:membrane protein [Kitasatospora griseola]|uniref:Membrane protein n=1 Tax=Kitasatospora griseola TaxID=2064 RepID=A0A0D0P348_KITGR|nr:membrane protein [Kitasatospora griseola]